MINIKRVYDDPSSNDGYRILVDRLWPRGLTREKAKVDLWLKEIAPSGDLRKWYHDNMDEWKEFKKRYKDELNENKVAFAKLKQVVKEKKNVTLLYSSKNEVTNNAAALKEFLS